MGNKAIGSKLSQKRRHTTPRLIAACANGNYLIVKTIIERGDNINVRDTSRRTPLITACVSGNDEIVELLQSHGADANKKDINGWSSLMLASQYGHNDVVKRLLDKGAEVNMQNRYGSTSLMLASQIGNSDVVKTLLDRGAEVNMQNDSASSSLMVASQYGHSDVIKILLDKGAEVNMQMNDGWSSLIAASEHGHNDAVKGLLQRGAEVNMQMNEGWSSLMKASQHGHYDVVTELLDKGAEVNMQKIDGCSSLKAASEKGHSDVVNTLLDKGAEVNIQDNNGSTSLMTASQNGHNNVVNILLDKGADVNMQNNNGSTSLMKASQNEHTDTVRVLLDNHADITIKNADGDTALDIAIKRGHENIVELLHIVATEKDSSDSQLTRPAPVQQSTIHAISQTDEQYKDVITPDTTFQEALDDGELSLVHNQEEESQDPIKNSSKPQTLEASNIIPEECQFATGNQETSTTTATPDDIGTAIGINPKQLDQPCSEDLLITIARLLPNWMEYADPLKMTPQEINGIYTDPGLNYAMKSRELLRTWYRKNAYTDQCHYRVLVEASCALGHADIAGEICKLIKRHPSPVTEDTSVEHISKDLILFKEEGIGGGAYGAVFKGEINRQPCAIKVLYPLANQIMSGLPTAKQTKQDTLDRFRQECEYLETFKHPNVVRHLATITHPKTGLPVLALELMDCNLRQFFSSPSGKDLPFLTQKSLCRDIASALAYIHSRHIVHRDLCSDNILLDCKGETPVAKVCDFGMSRIIKSEGTSISLPAFGHRGYLPPEATDLDSSRFDSSFDIFAFGAIMVQIVRCLPTLKSRKERANELDQINSTHPLKPIIEQCLLVNRDDRPSAIQLERKLT